MCTYKNYLMTFDESFSRLLLLDCGGGPEKERWFFTAHGLLSRIWARLDGLSTYKSYNRNNDINMQKILTIYCCEVEAVVGGAGLTPSMRSCPLILLISSSKLI